MRTRLAHVGVRATDLERSLRFWRDALGLEVAGSFAGCTDLTDGACNFRIFQHGDAPRPPHVGGMLDYLHVGVIVNDIAGAARRCADLGFTIIWDGVDGGTAYDPSRPLTASFKVEDPDGIVVDVTSDLSQWPGVALRGE